MRVTCFFRERQSLFSFYRSHVNGTSLIFTHKLHYRLDQTGSLFFHSDFLFFFFVEQYY